MSLTQSLAFEMKKVYFSHKIKKPDPNGRRLDTFPTHGIGTIWLAMANNESQENIDLPKSCGCEFFPY